MNACTYNHTGDAAKGYPYDSRMNLNYTYSLDRLSCVRQVWFLHIAFAYLVTLSGFACLATRILPHSMHRWHAVWGRVYILSMLWCMATAMLVHNTGLPIAVLVSFFIVLFCLTVGWI